MKVSLQYQLLAATLNITNEATGMRMSIAIEPAPLMNGDRIEAEAEITDTNSMAGTAMRLRHLHRMVQDK